MMFTDLKMLVSSSAKVTLTMAAAADGRFKVWVIATGPESKELAMKQPLILTGTPEELDAGFAAALTDYQTARKGLEEQIEATVTIIDAATKRQSDAAVKALKDKPGKKPGSKSGSAGVPHNRDSEADRDEDEEDDDVGADKHTMPSAGALEKQLPKSDQQPGPACGTGIDLFAMLDSGATP